MDIDITREELDAGAVLVQTRGEVDVYTAPKWRAFVREVAEDDKVRHVGLDLAGVHFFDSTALGCLVACWRWFLAAGGEHPGVFALVALEEEVAKIMRITGMERIFTIAATREDFEGLVAAHEGQAEACGSQVDRDCA